MGERVKENTEFTFCNDSSHLFLIWVNVFFSRMHFNSSKMGTVFLKNKTSLITTEEIIGSVQCSYGDSHDDGVKSSFSSSVWRLHFQMTVHWQSINEFFTAVSTTESTQRWEQVESCTDPATLQATLNSFLGPESFCYTERWKRNPTNLLSHFVNTFPGSLSTIPNSDVEITRWAQ